MEKCVVNFNLVKKRPFLKRFFQRNETVWGEGEYNMFTGDDDYKKIGKIHTWENKTRTHYQGHCGEIRGSANGFFPPFLEKNNTLELFSHEACR